MRSGRRRTLPFRKSRNTATAVGPDYLLRLLDRFLRFAAGGERRQRLAIDNGLHFRAVENLALQQRLGDLRQGGGVLLDDLAGTVIAALHQLLDLLIDLDCGVFAVV